MQGTQAVRSIATMLCRSPVQETPSKKILLAGALALLMLGNFWTGPVRAESYQVVRMKDGQKMILGALSWEEWKQGAGWATYEAPTYEPDPDEIKKLVPLVDRNLSFALFGGSWCPDSKSEMPKVVKLLEKLQIPLATVPVYGVDYDKKEFTGAAEKYGIERVATLVVLRAGKVVGRIVEYPRESWTKDLLKLLESR